MFASQAGNADAVKALIAHGADVNAKEKVKGETALSFAAAYGRADVIRVLTANGADPKVDDQGRGSRGVQQGRAGAPRAVPAAAAAQTGRPRRRREGRRAAAGAASTRTPSRASIASTTSRSWSPTGAASRRCTSRRARARSRRSRRCSKQAPTSISRPSATRATPMLVATINGHFDLAKMLLDKGADPNIAQHNGVTPLYAALNCQWAAKALYPQPRALRAAADVVSRSDEGAARQGRRSERAADQEGLVRAVRLRSVRRRRDRRDARSGARRTARTSTR